MNTLHIENVQQTALALYNVSSAVFWQGLPIVFLLSILGIYVSGQVSGQAFEGLFRRLLVAIALMAAFSQISGIIHGLSDHLANAYGGDESIQKLFSSVGTKAKAIKDAGVINWIKLGESVLLIITTLSFMILALIQHFLGVLQIVVWNLLHIMAPLALLACLFPTLQNIPRGIFMGLLEVALWKPVWVILCRILLAIGFGESPTSVENWLDTVIMNFAVAGLMASTPMLVHGFLSGSLASVGGSTLQAMAAGTGAAFLQRPMNFIKARGHQVESMAGAVKGRIKSRLGLTSNKRPRQASSGHSRPQSQTNTNFKGRSS